MEPPLSEGLQVESPHGEIQFVAMEMLSSLLLKMILSAFMLAAYERRIREKRLAIQMKQAKKDKAMFSEKVELARKIERRARKVIFLFIQTQPILSNPCPLGSECANLRPPGRDRSPTTTTFAEKKYEFYQSI